MLFLDMDDTMFKPAAVPPPGLGTAFLRARMDRAADAAARCARDRGRQLLPAVGHA
jgi:hypothetical protein